MRKLKSLTPSFLPEQFVLVCMVVFSFLIVGRIGLSIWEVGQANLIHDGNFSPIDLTKLTWYARTGFEESQTVDLNPDQTGVKTLAAPAFPISLNAVFATPLRSGLHEYMLGTTFNLDSEDLSADLALSLPELGENWAVYLNGTELRHEIYLDSTGKRMLIRRSLQAVMIPLPADILRSGQNQLVFHLLGEAPYIGLFPGWAPGFPLSEGYEIDLMADIQDYFNRRNALAMFQVGLYVFFGSYQLFFYLHQRQQFASLLLALFMLGFGAGWQFLNSPLVFTLYPDTSLITRLSYASTVCAGLLTGILWHALYNQPRGPRYLRVALLYLASVVALILVAPFSWLEVLLRSTLVLLAPLAIFSLVIVWMAWRARLPDAGKLGLATFLVVVLFGWDVLDVQVMHTGWLTTPYVPFLFSLVFSILLVNRYWQLSGSWNQLGLELAQRNRELLEARSALEAEVQQRTAELQEQIVQRKQAQQDAETRAIEAETLRLAGAAVLETLDSQEMVDRILMHLEKVVPYDSASVQFRTPDGAYSEIIGGRGYADLKQRLGKRLPIDDQNPATIVYLTQKPRLEGDLAASFPWVHDQPGQPVISWMCVPLLYGGEVLGILTLDSSRPNNFNSRQVDLVSAFAGHVALALQNAKSFQQVRQGADELGMFYEIGLAITAGLEMDSLLSKLHAQVQRFALAECFYVALYDEDSRTVVYPYFVDLGIPKKMPSRSIETNPGLTGWVIQHRETLYLPDSDDLPVWLEIKMNRSGGPHARSFVGVPLLLGERVVGVISMQAYQVNVYTPDQIRLLETLSSQAAIAIDNSRLYHQVQVELDLRHRAEVLLQQANLQLQDQLTEIQKLQDDLREQAVRDSLTGLFNRRYLEETLDRELARAQREAGRLGIVMLDIDHFKLVNDTYGHKAGDLVLQALSRLLQRRSRSSDVACRYGGEEFVLILPGSSREDTLRRAEELRGEFAALEVRMGEDLVRASVSLGVSAFPQHGRSPDNLLRVADENLYQAKQTGRNRVVG